jgi:hypothetical protein
MADAGTSTWKEEFFFELCEISRGQEEMEPKGFYWDATCAKKRSNNITAELELQIWTTR